MENERLSNYLGKSISVRELVDTWPRFISQILMKTQLISSLQWYSMLRQCGWWSEVLCPCFPQNLLYEVGEVIWHSCIAVYLWGKWCWFTLVKFNECCWQNSPSFVLNNAYCSAVLWCFTSVGRRAGKLSWRESVCGCERYSIRWVSLWRTKWDLKYSVRKLRFKAELQVLCKHEEKHGRERK